MTRLVENRPARPLKTSRRSLTGRVRLKSGGSAHFESSLERDWLLQLDFDEQVIDVQVQPFTLHHIVSGKKRAYTPDVLATFRVGRNNVKTIVYEVKPYDELVAHWAMYKPRFKAAIKHCRLNGWRFKILTEKQIRTPFLENITFLRRYKNISPENIMRQQLLYSFRATGPTTPQGLLAAAYGSTEARMPALAILWSLVAEGVIETDLKKALTMSSRIVMGSPS
jgi:hypothetical protein